MHSRKGSSEASVSTHPVTQAQADSCCGLSEQTQAGRDHETRVVLVSRAVLGPGIVLPPDAPALVRAVESSLGAPAPSPPTDKHVLLSIFLI